MPQRKMTLREQREARREIKQLRTALDELRVTLASEYRGTEVARGKVCDRADEAVRVAKRLGHHVVLHPMGDGTIKAVAVRLRFAVTRDD